MKIINELINIYNSNYKDQVEKLKKDNFIDIFDLSQEFKTDNHDLMILSAKMRTSLSKSNLMKFTYDFTDKTANCTCKFCNSDSDVPCSHVSVMLEEFNSGKFEKLCYKDSSIYEALNKKKIELRKEKYKYFKEKNEMILDKLIRMLEKNDYVPISSKIELEPFLYKNKYSKEEEYYLEFKVGNNKKYIVKNITELLNDIKNGVNKSFGKNATLNLNINNFDEKSKRFIECLKRIFSDKDNSVKRLVLATEEVIDDVFEIYQDSYIKIACSGLPFDDVYISREKVSLDVSINNMKFCIDGLGTNKVIFGYKYDYLIVNNVLKRINCTDNIRQLIRFVYQNPDFEIEYVKDRFIKEVYSNLLDEVEIDQDFKKEFTIKDFNINAYFDINDGVISYSTKYFLENEEVDISKIKDNIVSKKISKFERFIDGFGFENKKITDTNKIVLFLNTDFTNIKNVATIYLSENIKSMQINKMSKMQSKLGYDTGMLSVCFTNLNYSNSELNKILNAIKKKVKYVKLNKNTILEVAEEEAEKLIKVVEEFNLDVNRLAEVQRVPLYQSLKLLSNKNEFVDCTVDDIIVKMLNDISNYKDSNFEVPVRLKESMRSYQVDAFKWMNTLMKYNFCGILADDMGLGKTLEIIALLMSDTINQPSLIVCPKSLAYNWRNEFIKWETNMKVIIVNGLSTERAKIIKNIDPNEKVIYISSYDSLKNDLESYKDVDFRFMILDEAQFIKNHTTLKAQSVKKINSEIRFILTGTPIENTVVDLWSLFDFIMPNYLYNYNNFKKMFEKEITSNQNKDIIKELVKKITPFILRRTKQEVLTDLPEKVEIIQYAEMIDEQRKVYEAQLLKTKQLIKNAKNKIEVLSSLTRLRQICVDPGLFIENYNGRSAKVDLVTDIIKKYIEEGHKIILFSQFTSAFNRLEEVFKNEGIKYFVLTGKTDAIDRVEMAKVFNIPESEEKVFLVSLKAGGTGLNLVGADIVIHLDPWWNISAENQATDRAHRIGQKNVVHVIKLVCENSIEQKVIELQEIKKQIIDKVIADNDNNIVNLSDDDLKYILS